MTEPLTHRQEQVLALIHRSIEQNQRPPTYREIMEEFALRSTQSVSQYLSTLAAKGYIKITDRSIKLNGVKVTISNKTGGEQ